MSNYRVSPAPSYRFLNVNAYKQLGQEKEKEMGMEVIEEENDGDKRNKAREKRAGRKNEER